jgi:hypothetical protein
MAVGAMGSTGLGPTQQTPELKQTLLFTAPPRLTQTPVPPFTPPPNSKTVEYRDGAYYGQINQQGQPHGEGTFIWTNGHKYKGNWTNGKPDGEGKMTTLDGREYVGEWEEGLMHGEGTFTWKDRVKCKGKWKKGVRDGQGILTHPDGHIYEGEWKDGNITTGKITYVNGVNIRGNLKMGQGVGKKSGD